MLSKCRYYFIVYIVKMSSEEVKIERIQSIRNKDKAAVNGFFILFTMFQEIPYNGFVRNVVLAKHDYTQYMTQL